ncbi:MAG: RimK family alpha-L-glutamate ligase [Methanomassiliicoccales archaeon]
MSRRRACLPHQGGLFIRMNTDPLNMAFIASKLASLHNIPVIDDPGSIQVCADQVNMNYHLLNHDVRIPRTAFLRRRELDGCVPSHIFEEWGAPLILKEPSTSFSARVAKVATVDEFNGVARRFLRFSDRLVVQEFIRSRFDWRIGVLGGELLYACKYHIPLGTSKIQDEVDGHRIYCRTEGVEADDIPAPVLREAFKAAQAIGNGLYGVDLKETAEGVFVIEVNDRPSLESGEDSYYPDIYDRIVSFLMGGKGRALLCG